MYGALEVAMRSFDGAVLMSDAGIVAGWGHGVVGTQGVVALGQIVLCGGVEVAEGG